MPTEQEYAGENKVIDNMFELTVKGFPTSCRLLSVFNWVSVWRVEGRSVSWLKLRSRERRESLVCVCACVLGDREGER